MAGVRLHHEVQQALDQRRPVVALETAVVTSGLPRTPMRRFPYDGAVGWDVGGPINLETARLMQRAVAEQGATPATIAVVDGVLRIGLEDDELARLAADETAGKASARDLAARMTTGGSAGTTVSATLQACRLTTPRAISVFATGGIGGVHRGWANDLDISSDLTQLSQSPVCVVCSGAKSVLDREATLQALEALGVPVVGYGTDRFPCFYVNDPSSPLLACRLDSLDEVVEFWSEHWDVLCSCSGIVLANPLRSDLALDSTSADIAEKTAIEQARRRRISGPAVTPFLLNAVADATGGASLVANIALLAGNARLAAMVARRASERLQAGHTESG